MRDATRMYGYFVLFMLLHEIDFLCLAIEAAIMHETEEFSRVIRDEIIIESIMCVVKFCIISCVPFFLVSFLRFVSCRLLANHL